MQEKAEEKAYAKVLNLSNLPTGAYELIVTFSNHDLIQPLEINGNAVDFNEKKQKLFFAPVVKNYGC